MTDLEYFRGTVGQKRKKLGVTDLVDSARSVCSSKESRGKAALNLDRLSRFEPQSECNGCNMWLQGVKDHYTPSITLDSWAALAYRVKEQPS